MADFLMLFGLLFVWAVVGLLFFCVWFAVNAGELYFDLMPRWKQLTAYFLGGPIVWLLALL